MAYIDESEARVAAIRKEQADLKKSVDKVFDEKVYAVLHERYEYQGKCSHPNIILTTYQDGSGSKKCPECGWWCAWSVYSTTPNPEPTYPYQDEVKAFIDYISQP